MNPARIACVTQLFAVPAILAVIPGNLAKMACLFAIWAATFRRVDRAELALYLVACSLFTVMNVGALRQGVFRFSDPDLLGMPVWEFFMWGFYLLHLVRMVGGPVPIGDRRLVWLLAISFAIPFSTVSDQSVLFYVTAGILGVGLTFFHEPHDLAYAGYMVLVGAAIEYTGVWSGLWSYPGEPWGGVPAWFVTMWGGIGLLTRRLVLPILRPTQDIPP
jgi:hypothetical protein